MNTCTNHSAPKFGDILLVGLWTLVCLSAMAWHLDVVPPYHPDEYFYVRPAKTMVETGDYLTPYFHDTTAHHYVPMKRFQKPILTYWMIALSYKWFGVNLWSARFPSAVFGALCIPLTWFLARRLVDARAALFSALILPGLFLHFNLARLARPDMLLSFFILLAVYFFVRGFQDEKNRSLNLGLFYLALGLGFLTKGPVAFIIPGLTLALYLLVSGHSGFFREMRFLRGLVIILVVNLPWFLTMLILYGGEFFRHILEVELKSRLLIREEFRPLYFRVFLTDFFPWSLFLLAAVLGWFYRVFLPSTRPVRWKSWFSDSAINLKRQWESLVKNRGSLVLCVLWVGAPIIFFTIISTYHIRYIASISPAVAILAGYWVSRRAGMEGGFSRPLFRVPFHLALTVYASGAVLSAAAGLIFSSVFPVPALIAYFPLLLFLAVAGLFLLYRSGQERIVPVLLAMLQVAILPVLLGQMMSFFNAQPLQHAAAEINQKGEGNEGVYIFNLGNEAPKIGILTQDWVRLEGDPLVLNRLVKESSASNKKVYLLMGENEWKTRFRSGSLRPVARDTRLKKIKVNKTLLESIWQEGMTQTLKKYLQPLVLLISHP